MKKDERYLIYGTNIAINDLDIIIMYKIIITIITTHLACRRIHQTRRTSALRQLITCPITDVPSIHNNLETPPSLYLLNATSIAESHAVQQLATDLGENAGTQANNICYQRRASTLIPVPPTPPPLPVICSSANGQSFSAAPSLFLLNPTSLAKAHALQHLLIDLSQYNSQVIIITETWLKKQHSTKMFDINGYLCYRRDRIKRRGGGVAIYISKEVKSEVFSTNNDNDLFEVLWIKTYINESECLIGGLYHPPQPSYNPKLLLEYLERTIEDFANNSSSASSVLILAGDFNQLSHDSILEIGLQEAFFSPTHKGHNLDRIYTSIPIYNTVKAIKSTVITEHRAVLASADTVQLIDFNKSTEKCITRPHGPANHAALLAYLQTYDWTPVLSCSDAQLATDYFYLCVNLLLQTFYPTASVTLTSRDPPHVTPEIKRLLRKKNSLMRKGRIPEADSVHNLISKEIIRQNSSTFKNLSGRTCAKEMWEKVRKITGKQKSSLLQSRTSDMYQSYTAEDLNQHFSKQSTDSDYTSTNVKFTANPISGSSLISEYQIFLMLDKLKSTAAGPDEIPFCF